IQQTRDPQFVSSAYFLRFRFDEGKYALVGHESFEGRDVLRIEYYPSNLFRSQPQRQGRGRRGGAGAPDGAAEMQRMMNKVALVTLWIDPAANQILKYTFDNIDLDFLPAQWLLRVTDLKATMTMGQPFPEVWLPHDVEMNIGMALAIGQFAIKYQLAYSDY